MNKLTENFRTLTPAYGRDYASKAAAVAAFRCRLDWVLQPEGQYINIEQIESGVTINLRYGKLRRGHAGKGMNEEKLNENYKN